MAAAGCGKRVVLWFRNDLRLHDNYIVHDAVQRVKRGEASEVLPVYCFDPRVYGTTPWGHFKTGAHRAAFLLECVTDLKSRLRDVGSDLLVAFGKPEEVLPGLLEGSSGPSLVLTAEEVTSEETRTDVAVARALKQQRRPQADAAAAAGGGSGSAKLLRFWGHTMYHIDDLTQPPEGGGKATFAPGMKDMPDVFTPFREKVEKRCPVWKDLPPPQKGDLPLPPTEALPAAAAAALAAAPPTWEQLPYPPAARPPPPTKHPKAVLDFKGGETAALARLRYYLWDSDLIASYFDTRNGMLGGDYSTKFAPWLAAGCISPRKIYHEIRKYEAQRQSNKSTYWVIFELIWRDYFRFFALKHGNRIFFETGTSGLPLVWNPDADLWHRWRDGRTGLPLVDANMRELAATGFMSNRGRQNLASYLVLDLGIDWRRGADYFESQLLDYDVTSNWGNWVAAAGLAGGRINHFNIAKQSKDYDPQGDYVRTWCPELRHVPVGKVHEPWLMSKEEQEKAGCRIGVDYPNPIPVSRHGRPHASSGGYA
uniref:Cryptochrome DASH n=1 Tax=Volvox carteri f. nagariensis TaxID=3068 RepID=A0A6G9KBD9_VOLCA|nr:DASH cryptochrome [Volvox carteri f. nagariensis]